MTRTLSELADALGAHLDSDADPALAIAGVAPIEHAGPEHLTFVANSKYLGFLKTTQAAAAIISPAAGAPPDTRPGLAILTHDEPYSAFLQAMHIFNPPKPPPAPGVDRTARIGKGVQLADGVHVGANCVIEDNVVLGANTVILPGSFVGASSSVGDACWIGPNVTIMHECTLGQRVRVSAGTVIGADGFGFAPVGDRYEKIPQLGGVTIGDDVEIGACCTIDRATMKQTAIGRGTKIDNLVMIAHNVQIGEDWIIVSQAGIAGSTRIGNHVTIAAQAGLVGHITIGDRAVIMAQAGVSKSVPPDAVVLGSPARDVGHQKRIFAVENSLPDHIRKIRELEKRITELETESKKSHP
ncbi:MAG TPA: UDP-3-O-(3-hydroxymyristoyl)glucosamine N-acyltransferase [candidate division Zixibacteria bacterium]|nr:UDP-3-O-(3-hydroxymyristoyl)glucosamine N-acyltransferase [candidate division Zixibacteria bacterium]